MDTRKTSENKEIAEDTTEARLGSVRVQYRLLEPQYRTVQCTVLDFNKCQPLVNGDTVVLYSFLF
jgi:hypothetical protein